MGETSSGGQSVLFAKTKKKRNKEGAKNALEESRLVSALNPSPKVMSALSQNSDNNYNPSVGLSIDESLSEKKTLLCSKCLQPGHSITHCVMMYSHDQGVVAPKDLVASNEYAVYYIGTATSHSTTFDKPIPYEELINGIDQEVFEEETRSDIAMDVGMEEMDILSSLPEDTNPTFNSILKSVLGREPKLEAEEQNMNTHLPHELLSPMASLDGELGFSAFSSMGPDKEAEPEPPQKEQQEQQQPYTEDTTTTRRLPQSQIDEKHVKYFKERDMPLLIYNFIPWGIKDLEGYPYIYNTCSLDTMLFLLNCLSLNLKIEIIYSFLYKTIHAMLGNVSLSGRERANRTRVFVIENLNGQRFGNLLEQMKKKISRRTKRSTCGQLLPYGANLPSQTT